MYDAKQDNYLTRAQVSNIITPPAMGRFHQPYPFDTYLDDVEHGLNTAGLCILGEEYAVQKDGQRLFGVMEVGLKTEGLKGQLITSDEWKVLLGVRGSHDQSVQRGMALGSQVMVCSNLCFHGNIGTLNTKQTLNIGSRLPGMIRGAVQQIPAMAERQGKVFDEMKSFPLKPRFGDAALCEIYRRDGFSAAQLGRAINEWHEPSYEEHAADGFTAWRLLNASTQALKPTGGQAHIDIVEGRSRVASQFIEEVMGLDW
jgi:hypothetical protein